MTKIAIVNFNSGEVTPEIDARKDIEKYTGGCRRLDNVIPNIYGNAVKRPGTGFIGFSLGVILTLSYIVSYENNAVCYENDIVFTQDSDWMPEFICYENNVVCHENEPVTNISSTLTKHIVCYENNMIFYENNIVTLGI